MLVKKIKWKNNTWEVALLLVTKIFASSGKIPDEAKALSLLAPAPTMTSLIPGGGLLPIPTPPVTSVSRYPCNNST